jgi:hypothetical protein
MGKEEKAEGLKPLVSFMKSIYAKRQSKLDKAEGEKGIHQPISEGSGHSAAGMQAAGAKPGSPDGMKAKQEHQKVIREQKEIAKKKGA